MWILSTVEELHHGRTHKKNNEFFSTFGWQLGGFFSWQERVKPMLNNDKWGLRNDAWHITRHPLAACHLPLDSILVQIYCQYDSFLTKQINIKFDNSAASSVDLSWSIDQLAPIQILQNDKILFYLHFFLYKLLTKSCILVNDRSTEAHFGFSWHSL